MNDKPSSNANSWADLWVDSQRQYWDTWFDTAQKIYGAKTPAASEPEKKAGIPPNPWSQAIDFWSNAMTPAASRPAKEKGPEPTAPAYPMPDFGAWSQHWIDAQRQYWNTWVDMSKQWSAAAPGGGVPTGDSFANLLDLWSKFLTPFMPTQTRDWANRLFDLNKAYFQMGEGVWKMLSSTYAAAKGAENQWEVFSRGLRQMQEQFAENLRTQKDPWTGFATFWGMPLDNWRRVCSAFSVLPGDFEKAARGFGSPYGPESLHRTMSGFLSLPTIGYTREWQEELQRWGLLWLDHNQALQQWGSVLTQITFKAIDLFNRALQDKAAKSEPLEGLRGFYNLWIDCAEESYGEASVSPDFTSAQSRLTNSLFAIKRQEQKMIDEMLAALNMPTRRELDTSHRRVHHLQRRVWQVEQVVKDAGVAELREEIAALRRELETLKGAAGEPKAEKAPNRRTAAKSPANPSEEM